MDKNNSINRNGFNREIGLFSGVNIIAGIMIGSGIFYMGGHVLGLSKMNLGISILAWLIGGVISLLGGICLAELGVSMPKAGGSQVYLSKAYHPIFGFLLGFATWIIGGPGSIALLSLALAKIISSYVSLGNMTIKFVAVAIILIVTVYNLLGIKQGKWLQNITTIAKIIPIVLITGFAFVKGSQPINLSVTPFITEFGMTDFLKTVGVATAMGLWAYSGWSNLNVMTEEMKNPKKDLPRAIIIAISFVTVLYMVFYLGIYKVLSASQLGDALKNGMLLPTVAANQIFGSIGGTIITLAMFFAILGSLNGIVIAMPRVYYSMAEQGSFFQIFAKLHPKYKVPVWSMLVQMLFAVGLVFTNNLQELANLVVFATLIFGMLSVLAVSVMRIRFPEMDRPFKVPFHWFTVTVTVLLNLALIVYNYMEYTKTSQQNFIVIAIGVVVYIGYQVYKHISLKNTRKRVIENEKATV